MTLIRNDAFQNQRIVIGSYIVQFNEAGIADFPDEDLVASLLQIPGFALAEEPQAPENPPLPTPEPSEEEEEEKEDRRGKKKVTPPKEE